MKKYVILVILAILLFPTVVNAKEKLEVSCKKTELKTNEETECKIVASDLKFIITGVSLKIKTPSSIKIISSKYDDTKWKMLDDKFDVKNISLINEKPIKENIIEIASFIIKSNSSDKTKVDVILKDLLIGDQNYEKRKIDVKNETIYINTNSNSDNNYIVYIGLVLAVVIIMLFVVRSKKKD